jgi:hypothetical protein
MEGAYGEGGEGGRRLSGAALARELEQREVLALLGPSGLPRRDAGPLPASLALRRRLPLQQVPQRHAPGPPPAARRRHPPRSIGQIPGSGITALLSPLPAGAGLGPVGGATHCPRPFPPAWPRSSRLFRVRPGPNTPRSGGVAVCRCLPGCSCRFAGRDGRGGGWRASDPSHGAARYRTRSSSHTPTSLACRPPRVKMKSPKARAQAGMQGWERARKRLAAWRTDVCVCRAVRARAFLTDSRGRWGKGIGGWAREHKLRHGSSSPSPKRARFFLVLSPSVRPVD